MALPHTPTYVSPFDVITSQAENETQDNIVALANGTGLNNGAVTASKIDFATSAVGSWTRKNYGGYSEYSIRTPAYSQNANAGLVNERYQLGTIALPSGVTTLNNYRVSVQQVAGTDTGRVTGAVLVSGANLVVWGNFAKASTAAQNFTDLQFDIILSGV